MLLPLALLAGCVTDGPLTSALPVATSQASITVSRPNGWYGAPVSVDIDANGAKIASLAAGGSYTGPVPPSPVILTATCWSSPGRYTIRFNAEARQALRLRGVVAERTNRCRSVRRDYRACGRHRSSRRNLRRFPNYGCAWPLAHRGDWSRPVRLRAQVEGVICRAATVKRGYGFAYNPPHGLSNSRVETQRRSWNRFLRLAPLDATAFRGLKSEVDEM